jgi:hypothetical protein
LSPKTSVRIGRRKRYIIAASIAVIAISFALYNAAQSNPYKNSKVWNFDSYQQNSLPEIFLPMQQQQPASGDDGGTWIVKSDESAPSKPNVLAKLSSNRTDSGYSMLTIQEDGIYSSNLRASIKFKIISEEKEKSAVGLIVRLQDRNHYFVLVADAVNNRFSLCRAEPERLICTQDVDVNVTTGQWHTITAQVSAQGIAGYIDDRLLIRRYDQHYMFGQIGLWTKGDTEAYFDDLGIDY